MAGALEDCIGTCSFLTASFQLYGPCWLAPVKSPQAVEHASVFFFSIHETPAAHWDTGTLGAPCAGPNVYTRCVYS